jgi:hypothetical protein
MRIAGLAEPRFWKGEGHSRLVISLLALFLALPGVAGAASGPYMSGGWRLPTSGDENYSLRWIYVGTRLTHERLFTHFEYDVERNRIRYGYAQVRHQFADGFGEMVLRGGRFITPVLNLYPGRKTSWVTRFPHAINGYSIRGEGLFVSYRTGALILDVAHHNQDRNGQNDTAFSASLNWHGAILFGEQRKGYGVMFKTPWSHRLLNPVIGLSFPRKAKRAFFLQNFTVLRKNLRLYQQIDVDEDQLDLMLGLSWRYARYTCAKFYFDTEGENDRGTDQFVVELAFGS